MSKNPPAFQFYPSDFLSDENVVLMSNQEAGCYIKLLCYCWKEGTIPKDVGKLGKLCGETLQSMELMWPNIQPCFKLNGDRYYHNRLDIERKKQSEWREKSSKGGKRSARTRADLLKGGSSGAGKGGSSLLSSSSSSLDNTNVLSITAKDVFEFYISKIQPQQKSKSRAIKNIISWLHQYSQKDLKISIENYSPVAQAREPSFRKDPANFFGKQEPAFIDYLTENYNGNKGTLDRDVEAFLSDPKG